MKTTTLLASIVCLSLLCACQGNKYRNLDESISFVDVDESSVLVCDLSKVNKEEMLKLSDLVEDCQLIHFEDLDNALFKTWFITVSDKYIGVRQQGARPYKLFDHSGKFLGDIGVVGQGPGEYSKSLYDDLIDDKNERVYLVTFNRDILVYDTQGNYLHNIRTPHNLTKAKINLTDDGILSVIHMPFANGADFAYQFNKEGELINALAPREDFIVKSFDGELFNTRNSGFDFMHTGVDSLFHYDAQNNKVVPVFTTVDPVSDKPFKQYIELNDRYLTNHFTQGVLFSALKNGQSASIVTKLVDDFHGNIQVPMNIITFRNGWFIYSLEPAELMEVIEKRLAEKDCSPADKELLSKLLETLDENANNIAFLGRMK